MKEATPELAPDKNVLAWNLHRINYLLTLAEENLTEATKMEYRDVAIVPTIVPKLLTDAQKKEQIENLKEQKQFLESQI